MRILSLDLGKRNVKMVELESHFGRFEIRDYQMHRVDQSKGPDHDPAQDSIAAAAQLIEALPRLPDRLVMTLPSQWVTTRNLTLPTRDRKAIQAGVGFELEDELPFEIDDTTYDFFPLQAHGAQSDVHVIITLKRHLKDYLERLKAWNLDPDILTTESWSLFRLAQKVLPKESFVAPQLLVHFGETHSLFVLMQGNNLLLSRVIPWGGSVLRQVLSQHLGIPFPDTDSVLRDNGFVVPASQFDQATPAQQEFSKYLQEGLKKLLFELRQTLLASKSTTGSSIANVHLSGALSLIPGLRAFLQEELETKVDLFHPMHSLNPRVEFSDATEAEYSLALGMAIAFSGTDRKEHLQFRKKEFARDIGQSALEWKTLKYPILAASAVLCSFLVSMSAQSVYYHSRIDDVNTQLERSLKGFFTTQSPTQIAKQLEDPAKLRATVQHEIQKQRALAELLNPNPSSPLLYLKELSQGISQDVVVDLVQYKMGILGDGAFKSDSPRETSLTFYVATPQMAERLAQLLNRYIGDLKRSDMQEVDALDGSGKRWKIVFNGKATRTSL